MTLSDYGESLAYDVAFWMQGLLEPGYPVNELGKLSLEVADKLRSLAIIVLLTEAESDLFFHNLIRSGRARNAYLQRLRDGGINDDHHQSSGRYESLLDAIAAGDLELARSIAALSPVEFRAGHEYEDDYCYAQVLHRFVMIPPGDTEIPPLLERWEGYLDGQPSGRLDVCRALLNAEQGAFDAAFDDLLGEQDRQIAKNKARGQLEEPQVVAQREVFVEGLALLRIAESRGLVTQSDYRYCPALARLAMVQPFPGE